MAPPVSNAERGKSSKVKEIIGASGTIVNGRRAKVLRSNPLILALRLLQGLRTSQRQFIHSLAYAKEPEIPGSGKRPSESQELLLQHFSQTASRRWT